MAIGFLPLFVFFFLVSVSSAKFSSIPGINYGQVGNNLPSPLKSVELIKSLKAKRVKIYDTKQEIPKALSNTNHQVSIMVMVCEEDLPPRCLKLKFVSDIAWGLMEERRFSVKKFMTFTLSIFICLFKFHELSFYGRCLWLCLTCRPSLFDQVQGLPYEEFPKTVPGQAIMNFP